MAMMRVETCPPTAPPRPAPSPEPAPALELAGIRHAYGGLVAVDDVAIAVRPREIVCLVGPSGCGKSTLLRVAAGLEPLQQGEVRVGGRLVAGRGAGLPPERRGIGLVFQDYALFPHLTVLDNVRFGLNGLRVREQRSRAMETLERVGMAGYCGAYPHMLSGGQQQRVALARALAPGPGVLLLDEPFSGLDTALRAQVRDETLHVLKANGAATMIVTHDPEEAMFLADRIALMRAGHIEQQGPPVDLYCRPVSAFAAGFFGDANRLVGRVEAGRVATPVGTVAAPGLADGMTVDVLIRPEALILDGRQDGRSVAARVLAARLLGRSSLIHLQLPGADGSPVHVHCRMPGQVLPPENATVAILLDQNQAFIFPRAG